MQLNVAVANFLRMIVCYELFQETIDKTETK